MSPEWLPKTPEGRMARLVEECGEVLQALGKAVRFGLESKHPQGGPTNREALLAELDDLIHASHAVRKDLFDVATEEFRKQREQSAA